MTRRAELQTSRREIQTADHLDIKQGESPHCPRFVLYRVDQSAGPKFCLRSRTGISHASDFRPQFRTEISPPPDSGPRQQVRISGHRISDPNPGLESRSPRILAPTASSDFRPPDFCLRFRTEISHTPDSGPPPISSTTSGSDMGMKPPSGAEFIRPKTISSTCKL